MASSLTDAQREFLQTYTPLAQDVADQTGLHPSVVLGQIAQETGWGKHVSGNNIFGISPTNPSGQQYVAGYPDVQTATQDYVRLIRSRYAGAAALPNPDAQAVALEQSGYNKNAGYGTKVAQNAATIRNAGPQASLSDADLDTFLTTPSAAATPVPPAPQPGDAITGASEADLDKLLLGSGAEGPPGKPGQIDPLTGQPFQFASTSDNNPVSQTLNKPISEGNKPGVVTQAAIGLATDPEQRRRIAAAQLFPGMSPTEAQSRVFYGTDNRLAAVDPNGNPYYVDPQAPSLSARTLGDPVRYAASGAGAALPVAGGIAGGVVGGPSSLVVGPAAAAVGAGVGDLARQYLARTLDPAATPQPINFGQTLREAALSGAGQLGGGLLTHALAPNPLRVTPGEVQLMRTEPVMADARNAYARAAAQGVNLTPGQATGLPSLLQYEDAATTLPGTVDRATDFYRAQGNQLATAGQNMLSAISPNTDKTDAALMFSQGAQDATRVVRQQANAAASDAYERAAATQMPPPVEGQTTPLLNPPGGVMPELPDDRFRPYDLLGTPDGLSAYKAARVSAANDGVHLPSIAEINKGQTIPFEGWDYMKKVLQGQASEATRKGNNYRATQMTDLANGIKNDVISVNPAYGEALDIVAPGQRFASQLQESGVGSAANAGIDEKARAIVAPVFNQNPRAIAQARDAFEQAGRSDEWNAGVRAYIQDAFDRASQSQQGLNPTMLRRQVWGNVDNRDAIKAALSPAQYEGFDNFLRTVEDVARTYPMNSLSATRLNARGALGGAAENQGNVKALDAVATAFSVPRLANLGPTLLGGVRQRMVQGNVGRIVGHLFSPDGLQYLEAMSTYSPHSQRAIEATAQLVGRATPALLSSGAIGAAAPAQANPLQAPQQ